jgi:hypothetical protein
MKNFFVFLQSVTKNSTALVTSSAVSAVITVLEHVRGSSVTARTFLAITIGFFIWAVYKAWLEERSKAIALESILATVRTELNAEKLKKPAEEAQARLLDAQREEIELRQRARQVEEQHRERMAFLTAPDTGIRFLVRQENQGRQMNRVYLAADLATALAASQVEIEEALRLLRSQGFATETRFQGRWLIQP